MTIYNFNTLKPEQPVYNKLTEDHEIQQRNSWILNHRTCRVVCGVLLVLSAFLACFSFFFAFKYNLSTGPGLWFGHKNYIQGGKKVAPNDATLITRYRLENSLDSTAIYRNFKTNYETMIWMSGDSHEKKKVCYLRKMKQNDMKNSTVVSKKLKQQYNNHFYQIINAPVEAEDGVEKLIGDNAFDECRGSTILWVEPMNYEVYSSFEEKDSKARDRRSIRSCRTTCCWRVCCCDVHHFQWQVAEEFNCNHVCNSCSKRYKSIIEKLC